VTRASVTRRGARPVGRSLPLDPVTFVIAVILAGIALRVLIAGVLLPLSGYRTDVVDFTAWAGRLASVGPGEFYAPGYFSDYPPGYLYVLWLLGTVGKALQPAFLGVDVTRGLVKIPGILADGAVAWLLFDYSRRFLDRRFGGWPGERIGLIAAVIYLFNPGTVFDSAVWGQVDSVGTLAVLGSLWFLARGWTELSAVGAVVALLIKFQFAFLVPVVAVVGLKRHLFGRSADPEHDGRPDALRVLTSFAAGLGTTVALTWPFGLTVWAPGDPDHSLIGRLTQAADTYKGLSINALNLWNNPWSQVDFQRWGCDVPNTDFCTGSDGVAFQLGSFSVTWQLVGATLFGIAAILAIWQVARRDDPAGILRGTLLLAMAFFALPTRVHERYLFPALALAAPLVLRSWRWVALYLALSVSFFLNIYWVYTGDWSYVEGPTINPGIGGLPMPRDPLLNALLTSPPVLQLISAMIVVLTVLLAWRAVRDALTPPPVYSSVEADAAWSQTPAVGPAAGRAVRMAGEGSPLERLGAWLRPDPADRYLREPTRRLDRLDLVLLAGIVVISFLFRFWRVDQPPSACCFDEIYHARSATEWLADWEHGWTRDVYEWTHPMLAKYLIAAGIVVADPNKVTGVTELDEAPAVLAVAPQRMAFNRPQSVLFSGAGNRLTARDATTRDELTSWDAPGVVASLAYDEDNDKLLVGLADSGTLATYQLTAFLAASGPRAPPPSGPSIESGLSSVLEIMVPASQPVIVLRGDDGIAEVERVTGAPLASSRLVAGGIGYVTGTGDEDGGGKVVATDMDRGKLAILDGATLEREQSRGGGGPRGGELPSPPVGPLVVRGDGDDQEVYVPVGPLPADAEHGPVDGGISVFDERVDLIDTAPLPGAARVVGWQPVANMIYVAGDDSASGQPAVWTIQPLGNGDPQSAGFAAFDTTTLPGEPVALAFDATKHDQDDDHGLLLISTQPVEGSGASPALVAIDAGSNVVAWRLAGITFGSVMAGLIYLLAATMFRRRRIAVLAGLFVAFDAMSYVMSRIAMNDIFVATFIVAAYLLFWQVWSGRWARSAWWALPLVGVLIGLAAATKWVGIYALIGIWVLVLGRAALGRFLLVAAVALITVMGGIGAPWPFLVICLAALTLALVLVWHRPIRLGMDDLLGGATTLVIAAGIGLAFAIGYSQVASDSEPDTVVELVFAVLARGAQAGWPALLMLAVSAALLVARAVVSLRNPESDRRWYLPGSLGGFGWAWVGASLAVIPLLVYFLSYLPYLQLGHNIAGAEAGPGYGWTLEELHAQMFGYHFGLTAGHVASSPWWSWPLDLKPVWFYGSGSDLDGRRIAMVYNGGNPILFWAGVPAIAWCGIQAWRRRSSALVLLIVAFAFQFLPWSRIERATFQYHYLTAVVFAMVAVAYVVDELLRSWSYRPLAIGFLTMAVIAGILIFPLGSALAMPDWYINQARALVPWNYAFQFPSPPQGSRTGQLQFPIALLGAGVIAALAAAAFSLFGRELLSVPPLEGDPQQNDPQDHQGDRPQQVGVDLRKELGHQEPGADPYQDQPDDHRSGP
jgi:C-terminal four TMM region of protein-O-mannosyltransferase/Dolichyl-phosphate-mannose-protein mannosyltransferase